MCDLHSLPFAEKRSESASQKKEPQLDNKEVVSEILVIFLLRRALWASKQPLTLIDETYQ